MMMMMMMFMSRLSGSYRCLFAFAATSIMNSLNESRALQY